MEVPPERLNTYPERFSISLVRLHNIAPYGLRLPMLSKLSLEKLMASSARIHITMIKRLVFTTIIKASFSEIHVLDILL